MVGGRGVGKGGGGRGRGGGRRGLQVPRIFPKKEKLPDGANLMCRV